MREVRGRGRAAAQSRGSEREGETEEEGQTTLMEKKHASGCCLLRGQDSQNEKLPQEEHFIRAHPAHEGKPSRFCVSSNLNLFSPLTFDGV